MAIVIPSRAQSAGIPAQNEDTITAIDVALITGHEPAVLVEDMEVAISQNMEALTVVGVDADGYLVPAASTVEATGTLTFSGAGTAADTITIGSRVYTLRAAPTTVANEVKIGANAAETAANLVAAINAGAGAGSLYGSLTTQHPDVRASNAAGVVTITAKRGGTDANSIATTESGTSTAFGGATLAGGTVTPGTRAIGILLVDVVTTASGARKGVPIYRGGCFNPNALKWGSSYSTEQEKLNAFRGAPTPTNIILRRPKTHQV